MSEQEVRNIIREELQNLLISQKLVFQNHLQLLDGRNIQAGKTTGTIIGTEAAQKIGFYGTTPVIQGTAISDPSGGGTQDAQARTAINSLISRLEDIGIIATV